MRTHFRTRPGMDFPLCLGGVLTPLYFSALPPLENYAERTKCPSGGVEKIVRLVQLKKEKIYYTVCRKFSAHSW